MQTRDEVEDLHNYCRVFISGYVNTEKKSFLLLLLIHFPEKKKKNSVMALIKRKILPSREVLYTQSCTRNQFLFSKKAAFQNTGLFSLKMSA